MEDNIPEGIPTISDNIIQQDILLDDIKAYRNIIYVLLNKINQHDHIDDCYSIITEFNTLLNIDYDYCYNGNDFLINDSNKHRKYIEEIMNRLKNSQNNICDEIYNECYTSQPYQYYYLGIID
tara:strand:+ start:675 stop:1043 length:369 start_codon:yes stop_codon:yes gene_type:complete